MKVFVTGGTGFVGSALIPALVTRGHEVILLARPSEKGRIFNPAIKVITGESAQEGDWQDVLADCDAAINMAGTPIFGRWTPRLKDSILQSRILTTRNLVEAIIPGNQFRLISTSAVGVYGNGGEQVLDENAPLGDDFLASVAKRWEGEASKANEKGAKVAITRFGIVLSSGGGALTQLKTATRWFLGGPIGSGRQWFSWIHRKDLVEALLFLLEKPEIIGMVNCSSPNPVRQRDLANILGKALHRPAITPAPSFAVRLLMGEFADTILFSQRMKPARLLAEGFDFKFPDIKSALADIYT